MVTDRAGAGCISPQVLATSTAGDDVVNRKVTFGQHPASLRLACLNTTVNTAIAVALKYT
jgi:hypothetical protein